LGKDNCTANKSIYRSDYNFPLSMDIVYHMHFGGASVFFMDFKHFSLFFFAIFGMI